jgi:predicted phosphodiesterase
VLVKRKKKIVLKEFFVSDIHLPYEDKKGVEIFFEFVSEEKPDIVWIGGDLIDFYAVASWTIDKTQADIRGELSSGRKFLERLRKILRKSKIVWQEGNHEERLIKYIFKKADVLAPLFRFDLSIENILNLRGLNVEYKRGVQKVGKLYHLHGHEKRFAGQVVHIALNILRWIQRPFICGHFHRFNFYLTKELDKQWKGGWVNGCLFDLKRMPTPYEYVDLSQRGFLEIEYDEDGWFNVKPIFFIEKNGGYKIYCDGGFVIYE